jgi:hypothetical protein
MRILAPTPHLPSSFSHEGLGPGAEPTLSVCLSEKLVPGETFFLAFSRQEKHEGPSLGLFRSTWNFLRIGTVILIYGDAGFLTHRDGYRKTIFLKYRDA